VGARSHGTFRGVGSKSMRSSKKSYIQSALPAVVDVKPTSKKHASVTAFVRNIRVAHLSSASDLRTLRNHWATKYLEVLEIECEPRKQPAVAAATNFTDPDAAERTATGGVVALLTLTVTQRCSIAPTKVSQIRFVVGDGRETVPSFHDVLSSLRTRSPLPRNLAPAVFRSPLVRLLMSTGAKQQRAHHILVQCFDVPGAVDALDNLAVARGEEVKTNIITSSGGVKNVAGELTDERRTLRTDHRALLDEVQRLQETAEASEKLIARLTAAPIFAAGRGSPLGFREDDDLDIENPSDDGGSTMDTTDVGSVTSSVVEAFTLRHRAMDTYAEDRRGVTKKQAVTLAQCQRTWQEASSRGLELRKRIGETKRAAAETRHSELRAADAREAEFRREVELLQCDLTAGKVATSTGPMRLRSPSRATNVSVGGVSTSLGGSAGGSFRKRPVTNARVETLRAKVASHSAQADTELKNRQVALLTRQHQLEQLLAGRSRHLPGGWRRGCQGAIVERSVREGVPQHRRAAL
jgi:hypothetical protein